MMSYDTFDGMMNRVEKAREVQIKKQKSIIKIHEHTTKELEAQIKQLEERNQSLEVLFEMQHKRKLDASKLWQKATGKTSYPDLGVLLEWLMVENATMVDLCEKYGREVRELEQKLADTAEYSGEINTDDEYPEDDCQVWDNCSTCDESACLDNTNPLKDMPRASADECLPKSKGRGKV